METKVNCADCAYAKEISGVDDYLYCQIDTNVIDKDSWISDSCVSFEKANERTDEKTWCTNCVHAKKIDGVDDYIFCEIDDQLIERDEWFIDACYSFSKIIPPPEYNPEDVAFTEKDKEGFKQKENNDKYFKWFKDECIYWINQFELNDYAVYFNRKKLNIGAAASCAADIKMKDVWFSLSNDLEFESHEDKHFFIHKYAFHEVIELLMVETGYYMDVSEDTSYQIIHGIINKLIKVVFEPDYEERYGDG